MCKYQTKWIHRLIDDIWDLTRDIKSAELSIDIMGKLNEIRNAINDNGDD